MCKTLKAAFILFDRIHEDCYLLPVDESLRNEMNVVVKIRYFLLFLWILYHVNVINFTAVQIKMCFYFSEFNFSELDFYLKFPF